ncbi:MAG TPA: hypothetical protein DEF34_02755 [Desulfotomaculum sp.]|nr:MAG: hypothetical protein VR67_09260 [Peptococcaceae bacterium BRH_c8a]KJS71270.1 MAG: hypothetical protein JL56_15475 [Desulfotomaculum sp. BICA1-6]HBX22548.1 hypothetical protein [Desulfotomaculum sp.]
MRFLIIHVNSFKSIITEKGRSKFAEPPKPAETAVEEALVVLTSVEKADENDPETVAYKAAEEIAANAENLKVRTVVIHPFAHLFADLGKPSVAIRVMQNVQERLAQKGYEVIRTPFGWFNTLEINAKGHPYSRVARIITADS